MRADDISRTFQTLRKTRKELERRVQERTSALAKANHALQDEILARRRAEEELRFLLSITQGIAESKDFHAALRVALRKVCEATGWDYGEAWIPRPDGSALECSPAWYRSTKSLDRFRRWSEDFTFLPGVGLPGQVWLSKQPLWIQDISIPTEDRYPRCKMARGAGLKSALGIPILAEDQILAVLVFFMFESREEDKRQMDLTLAAAAQLGSMLKHKRAEQALKESEALLQAIIDSSTTVIFLKDIQGRYVLVNRQYEELFHITRERIVGKTDYEIFPKEMADAFRANDLKVLEAKTPLEFEEAVVQDDGVHTYIANKFLITGSGAVPYAICGIATDISERKQMEVQEISERKTAETWLHRLIETTQDAVISIDRHGRVVLFNPAAEQIFGYTGAEVRGQKVNLLMAQPYATKHDSYITRYEQTGERRAIGRILAVLGRRRDGGTFPMELSVTEVAAGGEVRYAAFIRDISEKIKLQEQVMESERLAAIGSTAAMFAHEVGNPLNGMSMTIQLLERRLARRGDQIDETVTTAIKRLKDEISRLSHLLQDFSSLSRREQYSFRPISLATVAREVCTMEEENYSAREIQVEQDFPSDLPLVVADRHKLKQALLNLCKNALEAMPEGGKLTLRAYNSGERLNLEITDTGTGIPSGVDIFKPFVTTKTSGTGLGLIIVRQIISAHGGMISYSSEPGNGTTFRLSLPLSPPSAAVS